MFEKPSGAIGGSRTDQPTERRVLATAFAKGAAIMTAAANQWDPTRAASRIVSPSDFTPGTSAVGGCL